MSCCSAPARPVSPPARVKRTTRPWNTGAANRWAGRIVEPRGVQGPIALSDVPEGPSPRETRILHHGPAGPAVA
jgi:hypothetical protein